MAKINDFDNQANDISNFMAKQQKHFANKVIKPLVKKMLTELEPKITKTIVDMVDGQTRTTFEQRADSQDVVMSSRLRSRVFKS